MLYICLPSGLIPACNDRYLLAATSSAHVHANAQLQSCADVVACCLANYSIPGAQGIAMDLLKLVRYRAIEQAAAVMYLHVAAYNDAAIAFYLRHGFRRAALLKRFYSIT